MSGSTITGDSATIQFDINYLYNFNFSRQWSGTIFPIYDSGLVLMMNLDKESLLGETIAITKEFSQYGNNGINYGAVWTGNGKRGGAYTFVEDNKYIQIPDAPRYTLSGSYTLAAWINPNNVSNRIKGIM